MKAFNFVTSFLVGFFVAHYVHNWFLIIGIDIAWIFILAIIDWIIDLTKLKYRRRIREQVKREIMNQQYQKQQKRINDDIKRLVIRKEDVK